ncbi:MAG: hypothetical protein ACM3JI_00210 [Anaerolineae bacterium]
MQWQFLDTSQMVEPTKNWPWTENKDAMVAAVNNHRVLFENQDVRVLEVVIRPGEKEELHTHRWKSIFIVDSLADMRYYGADGRIVFERPAPPFRVAGTTFTWKEPEGLHAIENLSQTQILHGIRIELKD